MGGISNLDFDERAVTTSWEVMVPVVPGKSKLLEGCSTRVWAGTPRMSGVLLESDSPLGRVGLLACSGFNAVPSEGTATLLVSQDQPSFPGVEAPLPEHLGVCGVTWHRAVLKA